jgi:transcriptional regulator with XRE-family HTH domain
VTELDLASARRAAGVTQADVAEALGISQTTVSAWERGRIEISIGSLIDYAKAVGVPANSLYVPRPDRGDIEAAYSAGWDDCATAVAKASKRGGGS